MPKIVELKPVATAVRKVVGPAFAWLDIFGPDQPDDAAGTLVVDPRMGPIRLRRGEDGRLYGYLEPKGKPRPPSNASASRSTSSATR
jgi:hypothetical protein